MFDKVMHNDKLFYITNKYNYIKIVVLLKFINSWGNDKNKDNQVIFRVFLVFLLALFFYNLKALHIQNYLTLLIMICLSHINYTVTVTFTSVYQTNISLTLLRVLELTFKIDMVQHFYKLTLIFLL